MEVAYRSDLMTFKRMVDYVVATGIEVLNIPRVGVGEQVTQSKASL